MCKKEEGDQISTSKARGKRLGVRLSGRHVGDGGVCLGGVYSEDDTSQETIYSHQTAQLQPPGFLQMRNMYGGPAASKGVSFILSFI